MAIKHGLTIQSQVLKGHVNKYALLGLLISIGSIIFASLLVSYQMTGKINISGIILAQTTNPAIWALDLTPFMFAYWGQSFCYGLANKAESIIEDKTREFVSKSDDLVIKLKYESNHDNLTNLPNSRLLAHRINQGIKQIQTDEQLALIILRINRFSDINFQIGRFSANSLLVQFAEKLKSILLEPYMLQAYMGMNMVARLQGAEFAVLIPRLRKEHQLEEIIKQIVNATSLTFMVDGNNVDISTSAGVAIYPLHGETDELLVHRASLCVLYAEKEHQDYAIYEPSMDRSYKTKRIMLKEINSAIEHEDLEILYEPIMDLKTGTIIGSEALVNFKETNKYGQLNSEKLVSLVEGTSMAKGLTMFVLKKAIEQILIWQTKVKDLFVLVHLYNATDIELVDFLELLLKENNVSPHILKIAVTEKNCLSDQTRSSLVMNRLASLGVSVQISDFCSGYASFMYLTNFPIQEVRIDDPFVGNMQKDEKKQLIVKAAIALAHSLNLKVCADGIPDKETAQTLASLHCEWGMGSYFSKEINADAFVALLSKNINH